MRHFSYFRALILASSLSGITLGGSGVFAASAEQAEPESRPSAATAIEEVTVTARRRTESVQDVPMSVSVLSSEDLRQRSIMSIEETFDFTPNVTYEYSGFNTSSRVYIRGIGNAGAHFATGDPSVALYVDGVYQARAATGVFDVLDLERIEVLRGPQGTLFGRNSTGGAIQVISRAPQPEFGIETKLGYGNDDHLGASIVANVPINDQLFLRGGIGWRERDGFQENVVNGDDWNNLEDLQTRLAMRYEATDRVSVDVSAHYTRKHQRAPLLRCEWDPAPTATAPVLLGVFQVFDLVVDACNDVDNSDLFDGASNLDGKADVDFGGVTSTVTWDTDLGTLTSVTAGQTLEEDRDTEADGTGVAYFDVYGRPNDQDQYSQEFRFNGTAMADRLDYVVGVYGFYEEGEEDNTNCLLPIESPILPPGVTIAQAIGGCTDRYRAFETQTLAAFGEATYQVSDRFEVTAGIRGTTEDREFSQRVVNSFTGAVTQNEQGKTESFDAWTPRFSLSYAALDDAIFYVTWSEGYKSGGFNGAAPLDTYRPESVKMWEGGLKSEWFDNRLQFNVAIFYGDYTDMQLLVTRANEQGQYILALTNAAESTVQGAEVEVQAVPLAGLTVGATYGYTDAEYDEFFNVDAQTGAVLDLSDNEFPSTPEHNYSIFVEYGFEVLDFGLLSARADWSSQTKTYMEIDNIESLAQENRDLLNASLTLDLPNGQTQVSLWAKNLMDEEYLAWGQTTRTSLGYNASFPGPPRWYGISLTHRLGEP